MSNLTTSQTLADMVDDVQAYVRSFTKDQDVSTHLAEPMDASTTTMKVAAGNLVSRGRIQVDDEVVYVDSIDREAGVATIAPYGRGMDGTDAVPHEAGAMVTTNPLYPRHVVAKTINQVISGISKDLYSLKSFQVPAKAIGFNYELPEDTRHIVNVSYIAKPSAWKYPTYAKNWTFDQNADPSVSSTGKCAFIYDVVSPLYLYTIVYGAYLQQLPSMDSKVTDSGIPDTAYDVLILGASARLLSVATAGMLQSQSVEASVLDGAVDIQGAQAQSKYLYALFRERLLEERELLTSQASERVKYQR